MSPRPAMISDYQWLYHHGYMTDGIKCAEDILIDIVDRCPARFLDYGCGRGQLVRWINKHTAGRADGIDPGEGSHNKAIDLNDRYDYIISCDVLEHIPQHTIAVALNTMRRITKRGLLLTIANMSDVHRVNGEEVELHLIQQPYTWWVDQIKAVFPTATIGHRPINRDRFTFIVELPQ